MADSSWLMGKGCSCQGAEDRSQRTEDGGRKSDVGGQGSKGGMVNE